jgi:geranylgeranyl pyrophosphate synthase
MNQSDWDPLFHEYAASVIHRLQSDELTSIFQDYSDFLVDCVEKKPAWQIALPVIACLGAGGSLEDGITLGCAWAPLYLASEILDDVEDKEFTPNQFIPSPELAINLATSLLFAAYHTLSSTQNNNQMRSMVQIFSSAGFDAAFGQHQDLTKTQSTLEETLNQYWEIVILKSGSVFRAATAGGAAAGAANEKIVETLGDYGTALGVMLQIIDDCRDAFTQSEEAIKREISLPLLLYLLTSGEENIIFPPVCTRAEWRDLLKNSGVIQVISTILLQWKTRALQSLEPLPESREKRILESIPSLFLERIASTQ